MIKKYDYELKLCISGKELEQTMKQFKAANWEIVFLVYENSYYTIAFRLER